MNPIPPKKLFQATVDANDVERAREVKVRTLVCPLDGCAAQPGKRCVLWDGTVSRFSHTARYRAAVEAGLI